MHADAVERQSARAAALAEAAAPVELSFEELIRKGDQFRNSGDNAMALWNYLRAHKMDPDSRTPRERIGYLHLSEDPERSAAIFQDLVNEYPDAPGGYLGLGLAREF